MRQLEGFEPGWRAPWELKSLVGALGVELHRGSGLCDVLCVVLLLELIISTRNAQCEKTPSARASTCTLAPNMARGIRFKWGDF